MTCRCQRVSPRGGRLKKNKFRCQAHFNQNVWFYTFDEDENVSTWGRCNFQIIIYFVMYLDDKSTQKHSLMKIGGRFSFCLNIQHQKEKRLLANQRATVPWSFSILESHCTGWLYWFFFILNGGRGGDIKTYGFCSGLLSCIEFAITNVVWSPETYNAMVQFNKFNKISWNFHW